jgi:hypothetical protein
MAVRLREFLKERGAGSESKGGPGSGNFGHRGRPGEVGGSGPGGLFDFQNPIRAFVSPTGQEIDIPSINWNAVTHAYTRVIDALELIQPIFEQADVWHVAIESVLHALSSPVTQQAMTIFPLLLKGQMSNEFRSLTAKFDEAVKANDAANSVLYADKLLCLAYEAQFSLKEEKHRNLVNLFTAAMEDVVRTLGESPEKVREIWWQQRSSFESKQ